MKNLVGSEGWRVKAGQTEAFQSTFIENYYGVLEIFKKDGKFFYSLDDYSSTAEVEISEELYNLLKEQFKKENTND